MLGEEVHRREHAVVGAPEVAEVVVGGVLASEDRARRRHLVLDERVPDARAHRHGAGTQDRLGHDARGDEVVDDVERAVRLQRAHSLNLTQRDDGRDGRGAHRLPALVDDEAPVGVAVEGESEVGAVLDDGPLQIDEVGRLERVGLVVREGAVELEVERDDLDGQRGQPRGRAEHGGHGEPAHAVPGIHDDTKGPDAGEVDESPQVRRVAGEHVELSIRSGRRHEVDTVREICARAISDAGEPGVHADPAGARAAELDAVVGRRVVTRREHRGGGIEAPRGEVALVGRAQADRDDVPAPRLRPAREGRGEPR